MISGSITGAMDFAKYGADPDGYADRGRGWQESAGGAATDLREQKPGERRLYSAGMWTDADGSALLKDKFIRKNRQQVLHGKMVCNQQRG